MNICRFAFGKTYNLVFLASRFLSYIGVIENVMIKHSILRFPPLLEVRLEWWNSMPQDTSSCQIVEM